jgi:hypothetical protein
MVNSSSDNQNNKVVLSYVIIEVLDNGIVRFEITKDVFLDMQKTMEMVEICKKLYHNKIYKSLKIVPYKMQIQDEVLKYLSSGARKNLISMEAVVVDTATLKFLGNFYLRIRKPVIKTKIFNNEKEAMAWLEKG